MLKPYLTPFFWSLTFCIVLYKPRQAVINFLKPLSKFEVDPNNDSYKLRALAKAKFFLERIAHPLKNFNMVFFVFLVLGYIFCGKFYSFKLKNKNPGSNVIISLCWLLFLHSYILDARAAFIRICNEYFGVNSLQLEVPRHASSSMVKFLRNDEYLLI